MSEVGYALGALLLLAAGAIGYLLRDRTARKPAVERANVAADELQQRQRDAAAARALRASRLMEIAERAAARRQEIGTHANETIDQTAERLGSVDAPADRVRQESAPGNAPKRRP